MLVDMKYIGLRCQRFRMTLGLYQSHVAEDTGYTTENISAFENGRNDNARILLWYFNHGMSLKELLGESGYGEKL